MNYELKEFKLSESLLNDEKKKQIIDSLDKEITEMRAKYFLKQPGEVKPISVSFSNSAKQYNESPISNRPICEYNIKEQELEYKQTNQSNNNGNRSNYSFNNQQNNIEEVKKQPENLNNFINTYSYTSSNSPKTKGSNLNLKKNNSNFQDNISNSNKDKLNNTYSQSNNNLNNYKNTDLLNLNKFNSNSDINKNLNKVNVVNYDQLSVKQDEIEDFNFNNKNEHENEELHHSNSVYDMINNNLNNNKRVNEIDFNEDYKNFQINNNKNIKDSNKIYDNNLTSNKNKEIEVNPNIVSFNPQYYKTQSKKDSQITHNYNSSIEKTLSYNNSKSKVANSISQGASTNIRVNKDSSEYGDFMRNFNKNDYLQNEDNEILIEQ